MHARPVRQFLVIAAAVLALGAAAPVRASDPATIVYLSPAQQTATIPQPACFDAHATDGTGNPLVQANLWPSAVGPPNPYSQPKFSVPGSNDGLPTTDANGNARFCLTASDPSLQGDYKISISQVHPASGPWVTPQSDTVSVTFRVEYPPFHPPPPPPPPPGPISVTASLTPATPAIGDRVTFVATLTNATTTTMGDVAVEANTGNGPLVEVEVTAVGGDCPFATTKCTIPSLAPGASFTLTLTGRAASTQPVGLTALASANLPSGRVYSSAAQVFTAKVAVSDVSLSAAKAAVKVPFGKGAHVRVHVTNSGPGTALGSALRFEAASGLKVLLCDGDPCRALDQLAPLDPAASKDVMLIVKASRAGTARLRIVLAANPNVTDMAPANDSATVTITTTKPPAKKPPAKKRP